MGRRYAQGGMNRYAFDGVARRLNEKELGLGSGQVGTAQGQLAGFFPTVPVVYHDARTGRPQVSRATGKFQADGNSPTRPVDECLGSGQVAGGQKVGPVITVQVIDQKGSPVILEKDSALPFHHGCKPALPIAKHEQAGSSIQAPGFRLHGKKVLGKSEVVKAITIEVGKCHAEYGRGLRDAW